MTSKPVDQLLVDVGGARSIPARMCRTTIRSEAQFKTLKYAPMFPDRFGSSADARAFCEKFISTTTMSTGTAASLYTPASVHHGTATQIRAQRAVTLNAAYTANLGPVPSPPSPTATAAHREPGSTNPAGRASYSTTN